MNRCNCLKVEALPNKQPVAEPARAPFQRWCPAESPVVVLAFVSRKKGAGRLAKAERLALQQQHNRRNHQKEHDSFS
jgi:hypothetical protein